MAEPKSHKPGSVVFHEGRPYLVVADDGATLDASPLAPVTFRSGEGAEGIAFHRDDVTSPETKSGGDK